MNEEHQSQSPQPTAGEAGVPKTAVAAVAADEEPFTEDLSANPERAGFGLGITYNEESHPSPSRQFDGGDTMPAYASAADAATAASSARTDPSDTHELDQPSASFMGQSSVREEELSRLENIGKMTNGCAESFADDVEQELLIEETSVGMKKGLSELFLT